MGLRSWLRELRKPLPGQTVMDSKADIDPLLDPNNTMRDLGTMRPNQSIEDTVRPD